MILSNTPIHLRQCGVVRLEITAIVMLMAAFSIVMVTNLPPQRLVDVVPAGDSSQVLPTATFGIAAAPRDTVFLMPAVDRGAGTP